MIPSGQSKLEHPVGLSEKLRGVGRGGSLLLTRDECSNQWAARVPNRWSKGAFLKGSKLGRDGMGRVHVAIYKAMYKHSC